MTTLNKSDLLSQKKAGKEYYFFIIENHEAVIFLSNWEIEDLEDVTVRNASHFAMIDPEEVTV